MPKPRTAGHDYALKRAAAELAQLLQAGRQSLGTQHPHYCRECGTLDCHPSHADPSRCWRCGICAPRR
jgi:ferredoxin